MAAMLMQDRAILNKKYPFLANFPFAEFTLEVGSLPAPPQSAPVSEESVVDSRMSKYSSPIIRFVFEHDAKFSINIHEKDLLWIQSRADDIKELDTVTQILNEGLQTTDILKRRDASEVADDWIKKLADNKTMLAYSTFSDVLSALIGDRKLQDTAILINNLNKLSNRRGLVRLTKDEYGIIMTYFHFRLVYTKLILGLVIASKISL
jgi:hypothetical protein